MMKKKNLKDNNIKAFTMYHGVGINSVVEQALEHVSQGNKGLPNHVSYDVDALDPGASVKCTGTKVDYSLNNRSFCFM